MRHYMASTVAMLGVVLAAKASAIERQVLPTTVAPWHYDLHIAPHAEAMSFTGEVKIDVEVKSSTTRIVLNAADLTLDDATLDSDIALTIQPDAKTETVVLIAPKLLAPGRHRLAIRWQGPINTFTSGFFALDYDGPNGAKQRMIATKFEPAAARRFMPLWDEPGVKATYTLTADVPAGELAISNTSVEKEEPLAKGLKRVTFRETPKMSSYLLFFAAGDLERVSADVGGTRIGVVVRKGAGAQASYALAAAKALLPYYNQYFGLEYPLAKLDLIAGPGSGSFGAMENWGAIFFFEDALLVDPDRATDAVRRQVFSTVAHEVAHQWFGDLVTMAWWNDLWLNEGFASWMASKALDHLHREWNPWLATQIGRERAMRLDALSGTHPVIQDVVSGPAANQAFDGITYGKGEAVIRMLEAYVGEGAFQRGVAAYMKRHAYGNTVNDDLWSAIEEASGQPVKAIAADFLTQPGVPLVRIDDHGAIQEGCFRLDSAATAGRWTVPLVIRSQRGGSESRLLLTPAGTRAASALPFLVNAGQTAYVRVAYSPAAFTPLADRFATLQAADQIGLISDGWALAQTGEAPGTRVLELVSRLPADVEPLVWIHALRTLREIERLERGSPAEAAWLAWTRTTLAKPFARLGWDAKPGEPQNDAVLRESLLYALGRAGDRAVIDEARRRFAAWERDSSKLSAALFEPVVAIVSRAADPATFTRLRARAKAEVDPQRKEVLYELMTDASDPALAKEMLGIATSGEAPRSQAARLVADVAETHPDLAWAHALATLPQVAGNLDLRQRYQYLPGVAAASSEAARADELHAIAMRDFPEGSRRFADQVEAGIRQRAAFKARIVSVIDAWVAGQATQR